MIAGDEVAETLSIRADPTITGLYVEDAEALDLMWQKWVAWTTQRSIDVNSPKVNFIYITLPCGQEATYHTRADVPAEDVPCPCGNPKHWLLKYQEAAHDSEG